MALLRFLACPLQLKLKFEQNGSVKWSTREGYMLTIHFGDMGGVVLVVGYCLRLF